jgi:NTP pyrophosphatase (non-canonical NTP hydrolase)
MSNLQGQRLGEVHYLCGASASEGSPLMCPEHGEQCGPSTFPLSKRLGLMADAMVSAVVGPKARFFSRERVDEIVLLLREAEKALIDVGARERAQRLRAEALAPPADKVGYETQAADIELLRARLIVLAAAWEAAAKYEHWRSMARDPVHKFWFTNREAGVLLARIDAMIDELRASALAPPEPPDLTFAQFSAINRQRCESHDGFKHRLDSWSTSDWFLATLGELGEAANNAKKLNRYRDGIPGNKESEAALRDKLRKELGDTYVYLDLLAQSVGVDIGAAAVEVFNAKSEEIDCAIRFPAASPRADTRPEPSD